MKKSYFRYLLLMELAENEQVRELVAQIAREAIPEPEHEPEPLPVHRPISAPDGMVAHWPIDHEAPTMYPSNPPKKNTAPGAI